MALCARPVSPMLKGTGGRQQELVQEKDKIHRIVLNSPALCVLAHVVSPNCVWFKLENHVSTQLQLDSPAKLEKLDTTRLQVYDYVMAPISETVYARGRVVDTDPDKARDALVYVHFIDEGHGAWMHKDCLAVMERKLYFYPWQAFPVTLFKNDGCVYGRDCVPEDSMHQQGLHQRDALCDILKQYTVFKLVPARGHQRNPAINNYREHIRAEVYGLTSSSGTTANDDRTNKTESIAHLLRLSGHLKMRRTVYESAQVPMWVQTKQDLYDETAYDDLSIESLPKWRMNFPWFFATDASGMADHHKKADDPDPEWDAVPEGEVCVQPLTHNWLRTYCASEMGQEWVRLCLDWNSMKSPHEFYAFPLEEYQSATQNGATSSAETTAKNPMRALYEQQMEWATQLDSFYGVPVNRKQFRPEVIARLLQQNMHPVYAIHESNNGEQFGFGVGTGTFRRVQVLSIRQMKAAELENEFCRIRYIDIGGSEIMPLSGLLCMHSKHAKQAPMCLQLTLEGITPPERASEWSPEECAYFKRLIRTDRPMHAQLRALTDPNQTTSYNTASQRWPGVFAASHLVHDADTNNARGEVEQLMVQNHMACPYAGVENGYH